MFPCLQPPLMCLFASTGMVVRRWSCEYWRSGATGGYRGQEKMKGKEGRWREGQEYQKMENRSREGQGCGVIRGTQKWRDRLRGNDCWVEGGEVLVMGKGEGEGLRELRIERG